LKTLDAAPHQFETLSPKSPSHFPRGRPLAFENINHQPLQNHLPSKIHPPLRKTTTKECTPKHWRYHKPQRGTNAQHLLTHKLGPRAEKPTHSSRKKDHTAREKETTPKKRPTDLVMKWRKHRRRTRTQSRRRDVDHRHSFSDQVLIHLRTFQLPRIPPQLLDSDE
jgi:hypothetical protein